MDAKTVGDTIAALRRQNNLTQVELADALHISNKTVSRWENGFGYPEVTQFPSLAAIFGVTVDFLMTGERKGIAMAGSILVDIVKNVDVYPKIGMLANVSSVRLAVGGCAPNTAINLAKIDRSIPISVLGKIGDDEHGRFLLSELSRYGIDCGKIVLSQNINTGFSDVISLMSGERTFFHSRGSNTQFSPADVDISALNYSILHIGYILLLDEFDSFDAEYGTVMARFLCEVQQKGIKTSIDVVSDSTADYKSKIIPALKYCNFAIMNEVESAMISDLEPYNADGSINTENICATMRLIASFGVKDKVIIHCKQAGFCLDVATLKFTAVPSLDIPIAEIKGSVGAGDAYCSGCLYSIYNGYDDKKMLEFASSAAACNLFAENSVDGMLPKSGVEKLVKKYGRKNIKELKCL